MAIEEGKKAPAFTLEDASGAEVSLADFEGQHVIVYFYPKDDTPGCTKEACGFRDLYRAIEKHDAVVLGISPDGAASHAKFTKKYKLPFVLLSDPDKKVMTKYGAWGEKVLYGKKSVGMIRSTFVIDAEGVVRRVFPRVKVDGHDAQVLAALDEL
jgi:peroxiredoxin Q/BCP